jgi:hypothetical protein
MSPIPLGILAASGGAAGAMELIATQNVTTSVSSVTLNSIPGTYRHLQIRATVRTDRSGSPDDLMVLQMNGDTTGSYYNHSLISNGSTVSSNQSGTVNYIRNFRVAGAGFTASGFAAVILDIPDYANANKYKTVKHQTGLAGNDLQAGIHSGLWVKTAAITSLTFSMPITAANFVNGTRFSIFGIKGE